jgi:hypothetical protein
MSDREEASVSNQGTDNSVGKGNCWGILNRTVAALGGLFVKIICKWCGEV